MTTQNLKIINIFTRNKKRLLSEYLSRHFAEDSGKRSGKEEQVDSIKMPGFVHPQSTHDEGTFTQKAKQQLEELKKRMDKPTVDSPEKKE